MDQTRLCLLNTLCSAQHWTCELWSSLTKHNSLTTTAHLPLMQSKSLSIILFTTLLALFTSFFAPLSAELQVDEYGGGNLRVTTNRLLVEVTGSQNVPKFTFLRIDENGQPAESRVKCMFQFLYQADSLTSADRLPTTQTALPSQDWAFEDWYVMNETLHFNITGTLDVEGASQVTFHVQIPENSTAFKFDTHFIGFEESFWDSDAEALVLGYKLTEQMGEDGEEFESRLVDVERFHNFTRIYFGDDGFMDVENTAYTDIGEERQVNVIVDSFVNTLFERFVGDLYHDPTIGYLGQDEITPRDDDEDDNEDNEERAQDLGFSIERFGKANLRIYAPNITVVVTGNQNVPKFEFYRVQEDHNDELQVVRYMCRFQHLFQSRSMGSTQRVPASQIALPSKDWVFDDFTIMDNELHFNISGVLGVSGADRVIFTVQISQNDTSFKFDTHFLGFTDSFWRDGAEALVLGYKISQLGGNGGEVDVEMGEVDEDDNQVRINFGSNAYMDVDTEAFTADGDRKEVRVHVEPSFIFTNYERFVGDLHHDPRIGIRVEASPIVDTPTDDEDPDEDPEKPQVPEDPEQPEEPTSPVPTDELPLEELGIQVETIGQGNLRITGAGLKIEVVGNQNVPQFIFERDVDAATGFKVQFAHLFQSNSLDSFDRLSATQIALPSLSWRFSDWIAKNNELHFNITGELGSNSADRIIFTVQIPRNETSFKFDTHFYGFANSFWSSNAQALVLGYKVIQQGSNSAEIDADVEAVQNWDDNEVRVNFGGSAYMNVEREAFTAEGDRKEVRVHVEPSFIYLNYERFVGDLHHDPRIGVRSTTSDGSGTGGSGTGSGDSNSAATLANLSAVAIAGAMALIAMLL